MPTPRLEFVPDSNRRLVRVCRAGLFAGRVFEYGAVYRVGLRSVQEGEPAVLVPRGLGSPRLGRIRRGRLLGTADEPCSPSWWVVLGPLVVGGVEAQPMPPRCSSVPEQLTLPLMAA